MTFPASIFKAYDIRGVYPDEITEALAYDIGRAYAEFMKKDTKMDRPTLVVCQDMRVSSPPLKAQVIAGMVKQGINVVDIGLASTPTFYFGVAYYGYDGGIQITASHNPAKYNGFKLVRAKAVPIGGDTGMDDVRDLAATRKFPEVAKAGTVTKRDGALQDQIAYALKRCVGAKIKPYTIVVDTANGMGSPLMQELFQHLPCKLVPLFFELDGSFPNHEADPLKEENNVALQKKILEVGADLGITTDGDADRIFFVDNTGKTIEPSIMRGILAQIFLRERPGSSICYDIRPGQITIDMIKAAGGVPVVTRVGHSLIKAKAREVNAVFAGESSGHFFLDSPHGIFEMPEIMTLKFLEELSKSGKTAREFVAPYEKYFQSGEINFNVSDKDAVLARLKQAYGENLQYDFDGLSFHWPDYWFNVRPSNTEAKLRFALEARSKDVMEQKVAEVRRLIEG